LDLDDRCLVLAVPLVSRMEAVWSRSETSDSSSSRRAPLRDRFRVRAMDDGSSEAAAVEEEAVALVGVLDLDRHRRDGEIITGLGVLEPDLPVIDRVSTREIEVSASSITEIDSHTT
jgi:hypothetical protein